MDRLMMWFGYITAVALAGGALVCVIVQMVYLLKNLWIINLRTLNENQLRHLISNASALLEVKERR